MRKRRKKSKSKPVAENRAVELEMDERKEFKADLWSRGLAIASLVVSIATALYAGRIAQWTSPYFYAAPHQLHYEFTESNRLKNDSPADGMLTLRIVNSTDTPARDVTVLIQPISSSPKFECDQHFHVEDALTGAKLVTIERIPAGGMGVLTVYDKVDSYPSSFQPSSGLKYQYCAMVEDVQTEFGSVRCDHANCIRFFNTLADDYKQGDVKVPKHKIEELLKGTEFEGAEIWGVDTDETPSEVRGNSK